MVQSTESGFHSLIKTYIFTGYNTSDEQDVRDTEFHVYFRQIYLIDYNEILPSYTELTNENLLNFLQKY